MGKATPGPWRANATIIEARQMALEVASVRPHGTVGYAPRNEGEWRANARLIAAAPGMLAALKTAIKTIASMGLDLEASAPQSVNANSYSDELRRLREVIAKAEPPP